MIKTEDILTAQVSQNFYKKIFIALIIVIASNYLFFNYRIILRENLFITADWLMNYSGGFVRRGLIGEIIYFFSIKLNINILVNAFIVSSIFFLLFIFFFYNSLKNYLNSKILLIYLFLPSTLLFTFFNPLAVGRKESLVLLFIYLYSYLLINRKLNEKFSKIVLLILTVLATLSHELMFFFIPYIFFIKFIFNNQNFLKLKVFKNFNFEIILFLLSTACILLIFFYSHKHNNNQLCQSLIKLNLNQNICAGTINDYSGLASSEGLLRKPFLFDYFQSKNYYKLYGLVFFLNFLPIISYFFLIKKNQKNKSAIFNYIILSLACLIFTLPILLIANDWGRYLNIHFLCHSILFAIFIKNNSYNIKNIRKKYSITKNFILSFLIFLYLITWYMPHCCQDKIGNGYKSLFDRVKFRIYDESLETTKFGTDFPRLLIRNIFNIK